MSISDVDRWPVGGKWLGLVSRGGEKAKCIQFDAQQSWCRLGHSQILLPPNNARAFRKRNIYPSPFILTYARGRVLLEGPLFGRCFGWCFLVPIYHYGNLLHFSCNSLSLFLVSLSLSLFLSFHGHHIQVWVRFPWAILYSIELKTRERICLWIGLRMPK